MPRYTYRCETCGTAYTLSLRVEDRNLHDEACPEPACAGYLCRVYAAPHVAMVPGTYTRYQQELDAKDAARAKRKDKAIRAARERQAHGA